MDYKIYFLDADGHIRGFSDFSAKDDEAAIAHARQFTDVDMEIWQRGRKIKDLRKDAT